MLPIDPLLPELARTLVAEGRAVLQAPPGAGKTTRVPLALLPHIKGKIIMLEPRRLAARAAADRLAEQLGPERAGTVGYRMRGDSKPGTRIEVVTEGILTRMIQSDPELPEVGAIIFDEFHERSLNADLGLALTLEARAALRPDLKILVMSATLDGAAVAELLDNAPILTSKGRSFPVDIRHLDRPRRPGANLIADLGDLIVTALAENEGGMLVFLPGEREIRQTELRLKTLVTAETTILPLFGSMSLASQRAAIAPLQKGRKLVLATSIAETSLTIEDIRVVVDAGLARRPRFDPGSGMTRLVTEKLTRAEATQRAGRAGRVAPGVCYRLWSQAEEGALQAFAPPEITQTDLTGLALELAQWGSDDLAFLTPPPEGALAEARALLHRLGGLTPDGRLSAHGQAMTRIPLHPRLSHMLLTAGTEAAPLAAILSDRDFIARAGADLSHRLRALAGQYHGPGQINRDGLRRVAAEAKRLRRFTGPRDGSLSPGACAALAYPDRIGLRRKGLEAKWLLSGGRGAVLSGDDNLAGQEMITVTDLQGGGRDARIRAALPLDPAEFRTVFSAQITRQFTCEWSRKDRRILSREAEVFGALTLSHQRWDAPSDMTERAMFDGIKQIGLCLSPAAERFRRRVQLAYEAGEQMPDLSEERLLARPDAWLSGYMAGVNSAEAWRSFDKLPPLRAQLDWEQQQTLGRVAPAEFTTPLGRKVPIDYAGGAPAIELRLQEMFGVTRHPLVAGLPIKVTLLSPARRPVQITTDLPGFWASSYADVRKDMRQRYPRHPWPEDPTREAPTLRAKPRG